MTTASTHVALPEPRRTRYGTMRAAPFKGDETLPAETEVVVIGGGISGACLAYTLAKAKVPVLLCEKAEIACEASSRAFGWITQLNIDPIKQPMSQASLAGWRALQRDIGEVGFRADGLINLAEDEATVEFYRAWLDSVRGQVDPAIELLDADGVAARLPTATRRFAGGLWAPNDGGGEPTIAAVRIAEAARQAGARIVTDCAVRGLDLAGGRVAGVFTERGPVRARTVISATNAWTRLLFGNHGIDVPQLYLFLSMGRTNAGAEGPAGAGGPDAWAWRRQIDGGYSLGGLMGFSVPITRDALKLKTLFDPLNKAMGLSAKMNFGRETWQDWRLPRRWNPKGKSPFENLRVLTGSTQPVATESLRLNAEVFPGLAGAKVTETWNGPLVSTPDNKPIISAVDQVPGLLVTTGAGYGFSWAPAIGEALAALATGGTPAFDLHPFRLSRFSDGSPLEIVLG